MSGNFLDDIKNYPDGNDSIKYYYRGPFPDIERIIYQFLNGVDRDYDKKIFMLNMMLLFLFLIVFLGPVRA